MKLAHHPKATKQTDKGSSEFPRECPLQLSFDFTSGSILKKKVNGSRGNSDFEGEGDATSENLDVRRMSFQGINPTVIYLVFVWAIS